MSARDAEAFLERNENDEAFAVEMTALKDDPQAAIARAQEAGFDFTPEEALEAFTERYGLELSPEQLEQIAAGDDTEVIVAGTVGGVILVGTLAAGAAVAAVV